MIENGYAITKAAKFLNINLEDAKLEVIKNSYKLKKEIFSNEKIPEIIQLYKAGVSAKQLGFKYGISKRKIQQWAEDEGIKRSISDSIRSTYFNQNIFDNIDTEEKAYWLGFFYADAYNSDKINTVILSLNSIDYDHLVKCANFFELTENNIFNKKTKGGYSVSTLKIYSKKICTRLTELGCPRAKSFIIKYPEWINPDLNSHFIRGLFDGDGSLNKRQNNNEWKFSLVTTKECGKKIIQIIQEATGQTLKFRYISKTNNNTYELSTNGNIKVNKIMNYLYNNSIIRLKRKYQKYLELISQQEHKTNKKNEYKVSEEDKFNIQQSLDNDITLAERYHVHPRTISKLRKGDLFSDVVVINNIPITADFVKSLTISEREQYVEPIFQYFRTTPWQYPKRKDFELVKEYQRLVSYKPNIEDNFAFNNSSIGTSICKHFCESFYNSTDKNNNTIKSIWNDDEKFKDLIRNRLVINWKSSTNESFNINIRMMIQGMRSMRAVPMISIFKPNIAKFICEKYSNPGDVVGDYSCGFGGRLLGAVSSGRKYIGTDPLTTSELQEMVKFFKFENVTLINSKSEDFKDKENSIDLYWSSPPYYDQEIYSQDITQAYNNGEDYFYNIYWQRTLDNVKYMLKNGKWFGLNVNNQRMLDMAISTFGNFTETISLKTVRSHLTRQSGLYKNELIYMFKNKK